MRHATSEVSAFERKCLQIFNHQIWDMLPVSSVLSKESVSKYLTTKFETCYQWGQCFRKKVNLRHATFELRITWDKVSNWDFRTDAKFLQPGDFDEHCNKHSKRQVLSSMITSYCPHNLSYFVNPLYCVSPGCLVNIVLYELNLKA